MDAADNLYVTDSGNVYEVNRTQTAGLVFSATSIGSTSTAQTITVSNNGNQALTVTSLAVAANFIQEPSAGTDCSSSTNLSSGGQCLIAVAFTPMQSGMLNGTLTLIDNALNNLSSTQLVQLSGSGLQLAQMITFTANAPATAPYNSNFTVAATASSNLPVVYTSAGVCTNSGATYTMTSSTGTCTVIANQFGNSNYSPAPQVTQTTNAVLTGTSIAVTSLNSIIYPNQSTALTATVSGAGNGGAPSGTVNFMLGANILGTGTLLPNGPNGFVASVPLLASQLKLGANSIDAVYSGDSNYTGSTSTSITVTLQGSQNGFGSLNVGTTAPMQTLTYQFSSAATLSAVDILTVGASGLDYTDAGGSTCAAGTQYTAGNSCTVNVTFTPSAPGMRAGAVTLFVQGSKLPLMTWYLNGIGQSGSVTIDPGTQTTPGSISGGAPYGSVVDGAGNVYVVDHAGGQVIEFAAVSFAQNTVLTGLSGPTAVAIDGAGNLYASDTQNNRVVMVPNENGTLNGTDMIVLSISGLGSPHGIAVDGNGNLYVADVTNGNVLEVPTGGGTPVMVAQGLTGPHGVAVDAGGNVYVATNNAVTEYPFGGGTAVTLGSGYSNPRGLAVDAAGNVKWRILETAESWRCRLEALRSQSLR